MRLSIPAMLVVFAVVPVVGCASQDSVDQLRTTNRALQQRNVELEQEVAALTRNAELARQRAEDGETRARAAETQAMGIRRDLEGARGEYNRLQNRIDGLDVTVLPPALDRALRELAAAHPDLMTYDPSQGMVRFASDFTFDSGSDQVKSDAATSLNSLATILTGDFAAGFEVRVVGHTDNVRIGKPDTRAKHPTNMHLSAHRAISVRDALVSAGVAGNRVSVAGWGEFRPVVANPEKGGARENRRVELFLVPMSPETMNASGTPEPAAAPVTEAAAPTGRPDEPLK